MLTHPLDASQWRALDEEYYKEFRRDPRNIRLGASIRLGTRASSTAPGRCLYGCTTSPLVVPKEEVHTHEYANSRADIARE
jgi:hypothetical protein